MHRAGPNPSLVAWLRTLTAAPVRRRCLVVDCGVGYDAEALASAGFEVSACGAPRDIVACRMHFPRSGVDYVDCDVTSPPADWVGAFDLVFDGHVLQGIREPGARAGLMRTMARLVTPGGRAFVVCRARDEAQDTHGPPWPLTREELSAFEHAGMRVSQLDEVTHGDGARHFVAFFAQPLP